LSPRLLIALIGLVCLLGGGWLWFRDSSLVAVNRVTVAGARGPDAAQIRRALTAAAEGMTTLDVSIGQLRTAVAPYPVVKNLVVTTQFPHGMRIQVIEQIPVALVSVAGATIAVAADGTLLHDASASSALLPRIPVQVPPGGTRVTGAAMNAVSLLAAAPYQLLSHLLSVTTTGAHGLTAQLRSGPEIYFGEPDELGAKWTAATAVLAAQSSAGAAYIDVSDPARPAAGAATTAASTASPAAQTTSAGQASPAQTTSAGEASAAQTTSAGEASAAQTTSGPQATNANPTPAGG
jgi:cell division protein FtsQ